MLLAVGALFGFAHAASSGATGGAAIGQAIIGAFAGLVVIPLFRLGIKIALAALALGVVGLVLYSVFQATK